MTNQSQEISKLVEALSKAQSTMIGYKEDSTNPFFKSSYGDLSSVWNACKKPLTENGLAVFQTTESVNEKIMLVTTLAHISGQWIKSYLPVMVTKMDPQSIGSAITYARRYALAAMVCVCPASDDDDGEAAMAAVRDGELAKQAHPSLTDSQCAQLHSYLMNDPEAKSKIEKNLNIKSVYDMNPKDLSRTIAFLKRRKEDKENESTRVA